MRNKLIFYPCTQSTSNTASNAGAAAGGVIGALIGLAAVAALVVVIRKRRQAGALNHALSGLDEWNVRRP